MSESGMVFVVDDDESVRRALARLLHVAGYCVQTWPDGASFLSEADLDCGPACLVLDLHLPDGSGLAVQERLRATLPVVFVSGDGDILSTVDAMKHGATDFLVKPLDEARLLPAVARALALSASACAQREELEQIHACVGMLTPREREVMALVVTGLLNKQVAGVLGTAESTVKIHRARVMEKMRARSFAELIRLADKAGMGEPQAALMRG
ncbi:response regulator transcription factor [Paraburkholderia unamae]|uniref:LuxR family two component transcriptional regulator n=1 Tax=Paraburkholderia unamae TaxID=219649 RepID=A0ABX5KCT3_9BURK|nr:response regulator [Paraburkholderia unamae]PVX72291.1 LuxR family two component transcriptional regulator [Paraburkholderia unamae]